MHKGFLKIAAVLGMLSVLMGAFAAHKLKEIMTADAVAIFETGVRYQFYHVFALLAVGMFYQYHRRNVLNWAGIFFIAGVVLFSGSLYLLTYVHASNLQGMKWVGPVTPIGGLCFIVGWVLLFFSFVSNKKNISGES